MPLSKLLMRWISSIFCVGILLAVAALPAAGQFQIQDSGGPSGFGALAGLGGDGFDDPVTLTARFSAATDQMPAMLLVTAKIDPGYHVYSLTQPDGGPQRTEIELTPSSQYQLQSAFRPFPEPKSHYDREIWGDVEIQEHEHEVTWHAPITLAPGVDPAMLDISGVVHMQACATSCIPLDLDFTAQLGRPISITSAATTTPLAAPAAIAALAGPTSQGRFQADGSEVTILGHIEPATVAPGGSANLVITAVPTSDWHVYAYSDRDDQPSSKPTLIAIQDTAGLVAYRPTTTAPVVEKDLTEYDFGVLRYHEGPVTWNVRLDIPESAAPGVYPITGLVGFQACETIDGELGSCELPKGVQFQGLVEVGGPGAPAAEPITFAPASYTSAATAAAAVPVRSAPPNDDAMVHSHGAMPGSTSLVTVLAAAMLGGLILNLMPCVLPVIGLKVMAFAEQAGQSRAHIFGLNLAYSAGLISVFLVLATLASSVQLGLGSENFGWGELYTLLWFKVGMITLVFAMALSFLGVWELPIPGFASSGAAVGLAAKEGYGGALFKGVFTTILATPCSGPFLGPVFGFTITQSPTITYLIFTFVGLGMALPYLVIGAVPSLVRWIPKPGAWMDTFKQLMGFVLLGTVVYLFSTIGSDFFIATLSLLVGIWFACWWIGRTPMTASTNARVTAWTGGMATAFLIGFMAFKLLTPGDAVLPWQPYSPTALAQARAEGKTVLVDFTADWCLTCKTNLKLSINRRDVRDLVDANDVVTLVADWTDRNPEIKEALAQLNSRSIPLLAIYPADPQQEVIVLPDLLTQGDVLEALRVAGPSMSGEDASTMATVPVDSGAFDSRQFNGVTR